MVSMYILIGMIVAIILLSWVFSKLSIQHNISKSIGIAIIALLVVGICLQFSYKISIAQGEMVVANSITDWMMGDQQWNVADLKGAVDDVFIAVIYLGIWFLGAEMIERWGYKWLPVCEGCNEQWSFLVSLKSYSKMNRGMTCPYCGSKQYVSRNARKRMGLFSFLPITFMFVPTFIGGMSSMHIVIHYLTTIALYVCLYPLLLSVKSEDEKDAPLW